MQHIDNNLNGFIKGAGLSKEALGLLKKWDSQNKQPINRPSWRDTFLAQAYNIAQRSPDSTKHGCIIVNDANEIVAEGFNGFIRGVEEKLLPNLGDEKYNFMIHAETNAIVNAARQGKSLKNCVSYQTGPPCLHCYQLLWQAGIKRIFCGNVQHKALEENETKMEILRFLTDNGMPVIKISLDEEYIRYMLEILEGIANG